MTDKPIKLSKPPIELAPANTQPSIPSAFISARPVTIKQPLNDNDVVKEALEAYGRHEEDDLKFLNAIRPAEDMLARCRELEAERDEWKQKYETLLQQRYKRVYDGVEEE